MICCWAGKNEGFVIENPEAIELLEALEMKNQVLVLAKNKDLIKSILDKARDRRIDRVCGS
jgi:hypothetical protein